MYGRGYTLVAVNANGVVQESECFDTYASSYETEDMADFINYDVSNGEYVIGVVRDEASAHMTGDAYEALESLGCSLADSVGYRDSYVFIARKGYANNIKEKLVKCNEGFAQLEMSAAGQPLAWYWFDPGRAYDPMIGRWMSVDPLANKYPPLSPYNYVYNNPIKMVDPNGKEGEAYYTAFAISLATPWPFDEEIAGVALAGFIIFGGAEEVNTDNNTSKMAQTPKNAKAKIIQSNSEKAGDKRYHNSMKRQPPPKIPGDDQNKDILNLAPPSGSTKVGKIIHGILSLFSIFSADAAKTKEEKQKIEDMKKKTNVEKTKEDPLKKTKQDVDNKTKIKQRR